MNRTTLLMVVALTLAILSVSNVSPSLAQSTDDCPYRVSGTSGRRACEDTTIEFWKWTAPATGVVTCPTNGCEPDLAGVTGWFNADDDASSVVAMAGAFGTEAK